MATLWVSVVVAVVACVWPGPAPAEQHPASDHSAGYLVWTSIGQGTKTEVDLWTRTASGCACPWNAKRKTCACCAQGGCLCGERVPSRCGQCGLQHQCDTMCNVTLDGRQLMSTSPGHPYGQIKSLELRESQICWYRFLPPAGARVEVQVYRLIDTGHLNHTRCEGGYLEWQVGPKRCDAHVATKLCGANERYSPPALLFSDSDATPATLLFKAGQRTRRGKLLAHYSFTPLRHPSLGLRTSGARVADPAGPAPVCQWIFHDIDCLRRHNNSCSMASPGYPGLYPPNRQCRYRILIHSPFHRLRLRFQSLHLPSQRCDTDHVNVWINGELHSTLCSHKPFQLDTAGPDVTVEFNSGPFLPPYLHNGFWATLDFRQVLTEASNTSDILDGTFKTVSRLPHSVCDYGVDSVAVTSGFFSSSQTPWRVWPAPCSFTFAAGSGQSVQLSLFSYNLTGDGCSSAVRINSGGADVRWDSPSSIRPAAAFCSPSAASSRNAQFQFNRPLVVQSFNSSLSVGFRMDPETGVDQFFEGAFVFHNESYGRMVAGTLCDTLVDGRARSWSGQLSHPLDSAVFWNVRGALACNATLAPTGRQSLTVMVTEFSSTTDVQRCATRCDVAGCSCQTEEDTDLEQVDHVIVSTPMSARLLCLCGVVAHLLPLTLTSNSRVSVEQRTADYRYGRAGPSPRLRLAYAFSPPRRSCGDAYRLDAAVGSISSSSRQVATESATMPTSASSIAYHQTDCVWIASPPTGHQWTGTISTTFQGTCREWNVTFHLYSGGDQLGDALKVLCPGDDTDDPFAMPHGVNMMAIRLQTWHWSPAEYRLEWRTTPWPADAPGVVKSLSSLVSSTPAAAAAPASPTPADDDNAPPAAGVPSSAADFAALLWWIALVSLYSVVGWDGSTALPFYEIF